MKKEVSWSSPDAANAMERLEHLQQEEMERAAATSILERQGLMDKVCTHTRAPTHTHSK